jgi:methionyl-tRNA formyltransferase
MAERVAIGRNNAGELAGQLSRLGADLMARALAALARGQIAAVPQAETGVTYAKKISKEEARIDWTRSAVEIDRQVRGLAPSPGAFTEVAGERLKILDAAPVPGSGAPGAVIGPGLTIACGSGALRVVRAQRAGGKALAAAELLKGFALPAGTRLG